MQQIALPVSASSDARDPLEHGIFECNSAGVSNEGYLADWSAYMHSFVSGLKAFNNAFWASRPRTVQRGFVNNFWRS
jgi:hypothetical protein